MSLARPRARRPSTHLARAGASCPRPGTSQRGLSDPFRALGVAAPREPCGGRTRLLRLGHLDGWLGRVERDLRGEGAVRTAGCPGGRVRTLTDTRPADCRAIHGNVFAGPRRRRGHGHRAHLRLNITHLGPCNGCPAYADVLTLSTARPTRGDPADDGRRCTPRL